MTLLKQHNTGSILEFGGQVCLALFRRRTGTGSHHDVRYSWESYRDTREILSRKTAEISNGILGLEVNQHNIEFTQHLKGKHN